MYPNLSEDEHLALYYLAKRYKHYIKYNIDMNLWSWYIFEPKSYYARVENIICLVCNQYLEKGNDGWVMRGIVYNHGIEHLKEHNLLVFL